MTVLTHAASGWTIGTGKPLSVIAGLNVLEDEGLALEVGTELKRICDALGLPYVFKASFDKANRSSIKSYRGPGMEAGLKTLARVKAKLNVPICADLHEPGQAEPVAEVVDIVQIPAFLCRQTDLVVATARATAAAGGIVQVKKVQFIAPWDTKNIVSKIAEAADVGVILCERGIRTFENATRNTLDISAIPVVKKLSHLPILADPSHGTGRRDQHPLPGRICGNGDVRTLHKQWGFTFIEPSKGPSSQGDPPCNSLGIALKVNRIPPQAIRPQRIHKQHMTPSHTQ